MKFEEVIKLLDAGYSRDEIIAMDEHSKDSDPGPEPDPNNPQGNAQPVDNANDIFAEIRDLISDMKKEFTAVNIMNSRQNGEPETDKDILASIINPVFNKK